MQKQENDNDKSGTVGSKFKDAGPEAAKLHDPYCVSQDGSAEYESV